MKKLFISQPMRGKSREEILKQRVDIIKDVKALINDDIEVVDSYFEDCEHEKHPLFCLGVALQLLSTVDCVYFGEGWQDYRGCRIEHECAIQYGIKIVGE